jgi:hypothetical protein
MISKENNVFPSAAAICSVTFILKFKVWFNVESRSFKL